MHGVYDGNWTMLPDDMERKHYKNESPTGCAHLWAGEKILINV